MTSYQTSVAHAEPMKRNSMRIPSRTLHLGIIAIAASAFCGPANADMGRTQGNWGVSSSGSATYSVPIWVQPGPKGMQPSLAFSYDSQNGNGTMGVGWSVSGFSSIDRCPWSPAEDGHVQAVAVNGGDRFCLGGNKLRVTSGSYGAANAEYQTEVATFDRIKSIDTLGTGPSSFKVFAKNGLIYEYGNTDDSRIILSGATVYRWLLNKVSDRDGNSYSITYTTDNTVGRVPLSVSWGPKTAGGTDYQYKASFNYTNKTNTKDFITAKQGSVNIVTKQILNSVEIGYSSSGGGTYSPRRQYVLTYLPSPTTSFSRLKEIKECGTSTSNCLMPTEITYQNGVAGVDPTSHPVGIGTGATAITGKFDFNGDGRSDIAYYDGSSWRVAFSNGSGFSTGVDTAMNGPSGPMPGRFLANHQDGYLVNIGGFWNYVGYNGVSFTTTNTGIAVVANASSTVLTDINGDGLQDIVWSVTQPGSTYTGYVYALLNTTSGSATVPTFAAAPYVAFSMDVGKKGGTIGLVNIAKCPGERQCDINGDGGADLLTVITTTLNCPASGPCTPTQTAYDLISSGGGYFTANASSSLSPYIGLHFNNDACTDTIRTGTTTMRIANCGSGTVANVTIPGQPIAVMDWDGDGNTDLLVNNGGTIGVYRSKGSSTSPFEALISTSIPYDSGCSYFSADVDGDGLDELMCARTTSPYTVSYYTHNGGGSAGTAGGTNVFATQVPDLLTNIADGYGNSVSPSYVSTDQSKYTKGQNTAVPLVDVNTAQIVVGKLTVSDGIGASYDLDYSYMGARANMSLGLYYIPGTAVAGYTPSPTAPFGPDSQAAGFEQITVVDSRDATQRQTTYEQLFPKVGMVKQEDLFQPDHVKRISSTVNQTLVQSLDSTNFNQRYFPYVSTTTLHNYQYAPTNPQNGDEITTTVATTGYTDFTYGNLSTESTVVTDLTSSPGKTWTTTITNTYDSPLTGDDWCVGFINKTIVDRSSTADGVAAVTRTVQFDSDTNAPSKCRVKTKTVEPNSDKYKISETYAYDDPFGNISSTTVVGLSPNASGVFVAAPARTTSMEWGTTGQFATAIVDPSGARQTFDYYQDIGMLQDAFDANSTASNVIKTSYLYDAFARKTQETRPDGTYSTWNYNDCASSCVNGTHRMTVVKTEFGNGGGTAITDQSVYLDSLDRPLVTRSRHLSWNASNPIYQWQELEYDVYGRVSRQYLPCITANVAVTCRGAALTNSYDLLGRLTAQTRPQAAGLTDTQSTSYSYLGRTQTITDPNGRITTRVINPDSTVRQITDGNSYAMNFTYDANGTVTRIVDSNGVTRYSAQVSYGTQPFTVDSTDVALGHSTHTYNAMGELVQWSDAKNQSFKATYDSLSRPLARFEPADAPTTTTSWTWGSTPGQLGKLAQIQSVTSTSTGTDTYAETYSYDGLTRLREKTVSMPIDGTMTDFNYDYTYESNMGWLDTMTYPVSTAGFRLALKYTRQNGMLQSVSNLNDSSAVYWTAKDANAFGQITNEVLGRETDSNAIFLAHTIDAVTGRVGNITAGPSTNTAGIQSLSYIYDLVGNVTQRQNLRNGMTENFVYGGANDHTDRLEHSNLSDGSQSSPNLTMTYNADGSIHSKDEPSSTVPTASQTISWTPYNYPSEIGYGSQDAKFSYGPDRQRWRMIYSDGSTNSETTNYIGGMMERVAVGTSVTFRYTILGGNGVVAIYSRAVGQADALHYVLTDNQGSVDSFVDGATLSVTSASFSAFGMRRNAATWSGDPTNRAALDSISRQGYTNQTVLGSMGLNHMNGRVQDATTGNFLSADPFITNPGNIQNYGRYTYVYDNPLSMIDPTGFGTDCLDGSSCSPSVDMQTVLVQAFRCNDRCWMIVSAFEQGIIDRILFSLNSVNTGLEDHGNQNHDTKDESPEEKKNQCYAPFNGGDSFLGRGLARTGNLLAGILDSVQAEGKVGLSVGVKLNAAGLFHADLSGTFGPNYIGSLTLAGHLQGIARVPTPPNLTYGEANAGILWFGIGNYGNYVDDVASTRYGFYEERHEGSSMEAKMDDWEDSEGKITLQAHALIGGKIQVDLKSLLKAFGCIKR